jgi:hypothetical protein
MEGRLCSAVRRDSDRTRIRVLAVLIASAGAHLASSEPGPAHRKRVTFDPRHQPLFFCLLIKLPIYVAQFLSF